MDLTSLKTFCRAVEEGNLTAAAKALHITKSVASRRIQALEEDVSAKLLIRTTRGVNTTDAGAMLYERATDILADVEDAKQSIACADEDMVGTLRITAPNSFGDMDLKKPLAVFMAQYPKLALEINFSDERVDIIGGGYDAGLRIAAELDDTSLIAKRLAVLRAHVVASPKYIEKHGVPKTPDELKDHNCVFYANVEAAKQWSFIGPRSTRSVRVSGQLTSNSGTMQLEAAKAGLAIATLPRFFLHRALEAGEVIEVLEDFPRPTLHLYALYPERRLLPLKVRKLIDFLTDWYADEKNSCCL
jgi:DNA-binding transcriptional LysR family regulator